MQKDIKPTEAQQGEVIAFYGDLTSVNPEDVDFKGSIIEHKSVLAYVNEHKDNPHFTMMYPQANKSELFSGVAEQIREINSQTQFMQINSIEEFASYYDKGNREMDRELHPVESVKMLAHQDSLRYDVKERAQPVVEEKQVPREYVKAMDISSNEMSKDLTPQINMLTDLKHDPQEFLDFMGLKGYDVSSMEIQDKIDMAKLNLKDEFIKDYALPQAGKTAIDNIEHVIPSMPAKSMKEGLMDGIEFVHDLIGDKDPGHLKIEFECQNNDISDCHIKGVYREYEQDKEKSVQTVAVDESGKAIHEHESNIRLKQETENDMVSENTQDQGYGIGD